MKPSPLSHLIPLIGPFNMSHISPSTTFQPPRDLEPPFLPGVVTSKPIYHRRYRDFGHGDLPPTYFQPCSPKGERLDHFSYRGAYLLISSTATDLCFYFGCFWITVEASIDLLVWDEKRACRTFPVDVQRSSPHPLPSSLPGVLKHNSQFYPSPNPHSSSYCKSLCLSSETITPKIEPDLSPSLMPI